MMIATWREFLKNNPKIKCEWMAKQNALINIDAQVYPCCYLANAFYLMTLFNGLENLPNEMTYGGRKVKKDKNLKDHYKKSFIFHEYMKYKDELNLMNNSLEEILNHKWFTEILPNSWNDENLTHRACNRFCNPESEMYIKNKSNGRKKHETIK